MKQELRTWGRPFGSTMLLVLCMAFGLTACGGGDGHRTRDPGSTTPSAQAHAVYSGTTAPPAGIGSPGDFYLNYSSGELFGPKAAEGWPATPITLATTGADGQKGSLRSGFGAPSSDVGVDGDFYLDLSTSAVSGPKADGAWPDTGVSLVGPGGSAGTRTTGLLSGPADPGKAFGADGDFYLQTTSMTLFGPKAAGAWPAAGTSLLGQPGATIRTGSGVPAPDLGKVGDLYLDVDAATLYGAKTQAGWPMPGIRLVGVQGPPGLPGRSLFTGAGAPDDTLGIEGDFYLDTQAWELWGPKRGTHWDSGVILNGGRPGADGLSLLSGHGAPAVDIGKTGDLYLDLDRAELYGPRTDVAWPLGTVTLRGQGPVVFVARFTVSDSDPARFYVPISGAADPTFDRSDAGRNVTVMPVSCSFGHLYVRATNVHDDDPKSLAVTLNVNEDETEVAVQVPTDDWHDGALTVNNSISTAWADEGQPVVLVIDQDPHEDEMLDVTVSLSCQ